ncbi:MAG: rhomboid family intramembrane serine protease [Paludibacteraceae bacterium]|nr:rhomboid family intramembrane serine protease [Paludibacteraceae bacterium]
MRKLTPVTRWLLIANFIILLLTAFLRRGGIDLNSIGGLHYVSAQSFHWWQPFTYMFLHANFAHFFFNMFALCMFGPMIEEEWGERRFSLYYIICGLGAGVIQELVWTIMLAHMANSYDATELAYYSYYYMNTIGASGAIFGILLAFGWLYPDIPMYIIFFPIPIRARTFVFIYAIVELFFGLGSVTVFSADNVAHFAHLGGMLFGWLLILYWKKTNWREPGELWRSLKSRFGGRSRLDSTDSDSRFDNYHYHKRV